jgi:hypothetical protein
MTRIRRGGLSSTKRWDERCIVLCCFRGVQHLVISYLVESFIACNKHSNTTTTTTTTTNRPKVPLQDTESSAHFTVQDQFPSFRGYSMPTAMSKELWNIRLSRWEDELVECVLGGWVDTAMVFVIVHMFYTRVLCCATLLQVRMICTSNFQPAVTYYQNNRTAVASYVSLLHCRAFLSDMCIYLKES